jgi:hypothetical protein
MADLRVLRTDLAATEVAEELRLHVGGRWLGDCAAEVGDRRRRSTALLGALRRRA